MSALALGSLLLVIGASAWQVSGRSAGGALPARDAQDAQAGAVAPRDEALHEGASQPVYRYSVVAGGVHTAADLQEAMASDAVVAAHYDTLSARAARVERVKTTREVYMSYRIEDRVYWTKSRVTLPAGETMLTDGAVQIRARCGNRISERPMMPTSPAEPERFEFGLVLASEPAPAVSDEPATALAASSLGLAPGAAGSAPMLALLGVPPAMLGSSRPNTGTVSTSSRVPGTAIPLPPLGPPVAGLPLLPFEPPRGAVPRLPFAPPAGSLRPPAIEPPLVGGGGTPASIPEPGTFLLVGTGVGVYVMRRKGHRV